MTTVTWPLVRRACLLVAMLLGTGCASVSNPVADGIPVRRLPPEVRGESKSVEKPIPLTYLRQPPPNPYLLGPGDVLGVWIEGVMGEKNGVPPVQLTGGPSQLTPVASLGYPVPVREDGTIPLPLIRPVKVQGLSIDQAQDEVIKAYTITKKILQPGRERVILTLQQPRKYRVLVVREDGGSITFGATGVGFGGGTFVNETRKSSGVALELPAYENDLLNALTRTGGLPGYDADKYVLIERGRDRVPSRDTPPGQLPPPKPLDPANNNPKDSVVNSNRIVKVPIRVREGEQLPFQPEDILLNDGDVVYVKARETEVFYTGGLLPSRAFPMPPRRDLDVVEAVMLVGGPFVNGGINGNNLAGNVQGLGLSPSPSMLTVIRKTPNGGQIPIRVSLNRALLDPRERILVQNGDILILQDTMSEALTRYLNLRLRFDFFGTLIRQQDLTATSNLNLP